MGYYIKPLDTSAPLGQSHDAAPDLVRLRAVLEAGSAQERRAALHRLIAAGAEDVFVQCLASAEPALVQLAVTGLWECWSNEAGEDARTELDAGTDAMNAGDLDTASRTFSSLMDRFPDWAEAVNKQATVLYLQNRPEASIELCRQVVALKPDHFGAWNGLALCAVQTENWTLALPGGTRIVASPAAFGR